MTIRKYPILILFFIGMSGIPTTAQSDFQVVKEWKLKGVNLVTVDRLGNFFIQQKKRLRKYDPDGKQLASLSQKSIRVEPWYHPSVFIFNQAARNYVVYDRNLENGVTHAIDPAVAIEPVLVCPTHDNKLWILDQADWSAKKINPLTNEVLLEFSIDQANFKADVQIREYLNLLILVDKNAGILILNHLGKVIESIEVQNLKSVYFFGEELYYLQDSTLKFFNLLTEEQHELKLPGNCVHAVLTDERLLLIDATGKVTLFRYTPEPE